MKTFTRIFLLAISYTLTSKIDKDQNVTDFNSSLPGDLLSN